MDSTNGYDPTLPVELEGSINPDLLTNYGSHLEYQDGSVPMVAKTSNGRMSPVRARTMKEYDEQIAVLKKENFSLKLRIYFLEERMQQKFGDGEDVFKTNIELKVKCESQKRELAEKHNLLKTASNAIESLSSNHQLDISNIRAQIEKDFKDSNNKLASQLDSTQKALEENDIFLEERNSQIEQLQEQLDNMAAEVKQAHLKGDHSIKDLKQELNDKDIEIQCLVNKNCVYEEDVDLLRQQKEHAEDELEKLERELGRRGRDLEQLSCIVKDSTLLDSQSFLLNNHLQDAVDDQRDEMNKLEENVKDKDEAIGKLEDLLRSVEVKRKDTEDAFQKSEDRLLQERTKAELRDKTIKGLRVAVAQKAKEVESLAEKLKVKEDGMKKMQEEFHNAAVERQTELDCQHEKINSLEQSDADLKSQLGDHEQQLENLMRSLGRKEGELEGFKDLLDKAQNALQQSEDAVEVLQDQLKKEKVVSDPPSPYRSPVKHYKDLLDESQKRVGEKDHMIHQLNDTLRDKDRQLRTCMGIFDGPQEPANAEMVDTLTRQLKDSDRVLARALEDRTLAVAEKEEELDRLKKILNDKEADSMRANKMLLTTEDTIECLEKANKEKDNDLKRASDMMKNAEKALEDAKLNYVQTLAEKDAIIGRLQDSIGDKEALLKETMKRAPMTTDEVMQLTKSLQEKDRALQDVIDEKDKILTANADRVNGLMRKLQGKEAELGQMSDKYKKNIANMEEEMEKMGGDVRKAEAELRRKQTELQTADNQASWSHQQSQDMLGKLRAIIVDKDRNISSLLDSVQEKDKINAQLRHDLQGRDDLVNKLQMLLRQSGPGPDHSARLQELQIELAVKVESLKNARRTEQDLREQIHELKQKLDAAPKGDKEYHTLEKQVYYLKDQLEGQGWTPAPDVGSQGWQLQETLQAQLEELRRLNAAVQREREILEGIRDRGQGSHHSGSVEEDLSAILTLRRNLEEGIQHNNQMRTHLEQQRKDASTRQSSLDNMDDVKRTLSFLKLELESSKLNNVFLQSRIHELQTRPRADAEGKAESYNQGAQTSPTSGTWSVTNKQGQSPVDGNIQLNRQSLSDMSAPMLRRLIRQLQQQLSDEEKENAELRKKLSVMGDVRNIPGKNDDDENSIPYLRSEIQRQEKEIDRRESVISELRTRLGSGTTDSGGSSLADQRNEILKLTHELNEKREVISMLKYQLSLNAESQGNNFNPELIVKMAGEIQKLKSAMLQSKSDGSISSDTSEVSVQTSPVRSASVSSVGDDTTLKGISQRKVSQIPRLRFCVNQPLIGDVSSINQPETLKSLLMESKSRITDLENKLRATEGTVRHQTQKMKHYKCLLEDHGLLNRSPICSRSNSETNLATLTSKIPVWKRTASQENLPSSVGTKDSVMNGGGTFENFGSSDDKETLRDQVIQLKELLAGQSKDIRSLRSRVEKDNETYVDQNIQTLHSLDETFVARDTLRDLYQQMETLQKHLQETRDTNAELQRKLLQQQQADAPTNALKYELQQSRAKTAALAEQVAAFQASSVHEILESQKSEIAVLRKKLSDTQNSCSQLNQWLDELSTFLTELVYVDQDGDRGQVRGMKHKVDMSRDIIRSMSTSILDSFESTYDLTSDEPQTDESKRLAVENDVLRRSEASLTQGLRQKNVEVEELTCELRKKNAFVDQLQQELLHFHHLNRKSESPKSSSTVSSADGNVNPSGKALRESHESQSPNHSRLSEQVSLRSPERMRHPTDGSATDNSHNRLDRTPDDNVIVEDMADSSQGSTGYHSSHLSGDEFMPVPSHVHNITESEKETSHYVSLFGTDEKLYNRRLADGQMFDNSAITPPMFNMNGDVTLPNKSSNLSDSRHVEFSVVENKSLREEGEVESLLARLNAVEDLNQTLKDELNVYENLCTSIGVQNSQVNMSPRSKDRQQTDTDLLREHLAELRGLRIKLEHSVKDSDRLRHQLELNMDGHTVTDSTQNVYMYSKQQTTITELQQTIRLLQQQLRENQSTVRDKIITIQDRDRTVQKLQQELRGTRTSTGGKGPGEDVSIQDRDRTVQKLQQELRATRTSTGGKGPGEDFSIREWHEKIRSQEQTCVVQQRRIEQQDILLEQIHKKLQLQEHSLHHQETKLKDMHELGQQKDQVMQDKDGMILRRGEQINQLEEAAENMEKKMSQLLDSIQLQREQVQQKETLMKKLKEEIQKRGDTIKQQEEKVVEKEQAITELGEKMQSLSTVVKEHAESIQQKEKSVQKYEKQMRQFCEKVKQLEKLKVEKDEANKRLVERNEVLDQDNYKLVAQIDELEIQLKQTSSEVDRLTRDIDTVQEKAQENRDLNQTLKLELSVYEKLQAEKEGSSREPFGGFDIRELLTEIRHLRVQLERCIDTNNALRQKLEENLLHQANPHHVTTTTNIFTVKDGSPARSNGTDVPDGQPSPERPYVNSSLTIKHVQSHRSPLSSRSTSQDSNSESMSVSCPSDTPSLSGFGVATWPPMSTEGVMHSQERELYISQSSPGGTLHQSLVDLTKLEFTARPVMSEGNLSYYADDPPSSVADLTGIKVDSDLRLLFAVGKLDDYEKLKKENSETLVVLKGIEARIQERLRVFKNMPASESVEYSTLKELSLSSENLRICLDEESSLIGCFWTTQLPKSGSDPRVLAENKFLRAELFDTQSKFDLMIKMVKDAETRLHSSNQQKQSMEEIIHRQLKKTKRVVSKTRTNFERNNSDCQQLVPTTDGQGRSRGMDRDNEVSYS